MFANGELRRLAARKAELLAASAANRAAMVQSCAQLRRSTAWVELGYHIFLKVRANAATVLSLAGLAGTVREHGVFAWIKRVAAGLQLWHRLKARYTRTSADAPTEAKD